VSWDIAKPLTSSVRALAPVALGFQADRLRIRIKNNDRHDNSSANPAESIV
jgi:hypothetical protein